MNTELAKRAMNPSSIGLTSGGNGLATSTPPPQQKLHVRLGKCYHCRELGQMKDAHNRPQLHCKKLDGEIDPDVCGNIVAGCEE